MGKLFSLAERLSPKIADAFGLKPAFVTFLFISLGGIVYMVYNISAEFTRQNDLLLTQIENSNRTIESLVGKIDRHEVRIVSLEARVEKESSEAISIRSKINDNLARLDTKLDMVTFDVRQLTAHAIEKKR